MGTGARGLRGVLEKVMRDVMYIAPKVAGKYDTLTITEDDVRSRMEGQCRIAE